MRNWLLALAALVLVCTPAKANWVWVPTGQVETVISDTPAEPVIEDIDEGVPVVELPVQDTTPIIEDQPQLADSYLPVNNDILVPYQEVDISDEVELYIEENSVTEQHYAVYVEEVNEILEYIAVGETFYIEENYDNFNAIVRDDVLYQHERKHQ